MDNKKVQKPGIKPVKKIKASVDKTSARLKPDTTKKK